MVDQGANEHARFQGIAHPDGRIGRLQARQEVVVKAVMQEQPAQCGAALAGRTHRRKGHAAQGQVKVRGGGDDGGVVAAEFQQATAKAGGYPWAYFAPHAGGPCGRNQRHLGAIHQHLAQCAPADQHGRQARRGRAAFGVEPGDRALQ